MLLNFLKMELYRLLKMKSTYVMVIIVFLVTLVYNFVILGLDVDALIGKAFGADMTVDYSTEDDYGVYEDDGYSVFSGGYDSTQEQSQVAKRSIVGVGVCYYNTIAETYQMNVQGLVPLLLLSILFGLFYGNDRLYTAPK